MRRSLEFWAIIATVIITTLGATFWLGELAGALRHDVTGIKEDIGALQDGSHETYEFHMLMESRMTRLEAAVEHLVGPTHNGAGISGHSHNRGGESD